jgi:hypothetical protein
MTRAKRTTLLRAAALAGLMVWLQSGVSARSAEYVMKFGTATLARIFVSPGFVIGV